MFHQNAIQESRLELRQCIDAYSYYVHPRFTNSKVFKLQEIIITITTMIIPLQISKPYMDSQILETGKQPRGIECPWS